jgi:hypothetical protein
VLSRYLLYGGSDMTVFQAHGVEELAGLQQWAAHTGELVLPQPGMYTVGVVNVRLSAAHPGADEEFGNSRATADNVLGVDEFRKGYWQG